MLDRITALLARTIGLDVASVGMSVVEHAVHLRQTACGIADLATYSAHLDGSEDELQALIDAVVVPETWFFRDRPAFDAMVHHVLEEGLATRPDRQLRLLSLACATGEEPCSMAMALLDAGVPAACFQIDGIDVSGRNIAAARRAIYGRNAFRDADLGFRDRYFETLHDGLHRVVESVRHQVRFARGNLRDPALLPDLGLYDAVFCRNVLIYFTREMQDLTLRVLARVLTPNGLLFVGPAEAGLPQRPDFVWSKLPMAFAFRRAGPEAVATAQEPRRRPLALRPATQPKPALPRRRPAAPPPAVAAPQGLDAAQRLADQGHLVDAAKCCEAHLRTHGPSSQGLYLLGLIRDASGDPAGAIEAYRKALYLDPVHQEALVHLALLLERGNDAAGARVMQDRIRRLAQREPT